MKVVLQFLGVEYPTYVLTRSRDREWVTNTFAIILFIRE